MSIVHHILLCLTLVAGQMYLIRCATLHSRHWQRVQTNDLPQLRAISAYSILAVVVLSMITAPAPYWILLYATAAALSAFVVVWIAEDQQKTRWKQHDTDFVENGLSLIPFSDDLRAEYVTRSAQRTGRAA